MAGLPSTPTDDPPESLTRREHEILTYLVNGLSNQEIARKLFLAEKTVRWHNTQIFSKLGVSNRKEAVEKAVTFSLLGVMSAPSAPVPRHNLPLQPTPFVGRQRELEFIASQFNNLGTKLVTILALGGMGKTRLALAAAEHQLQLFRDGVFFVPLSTLSSPDDILMAIADHVGFNFYGSTSPRQQLLDYFRERQMLLVLDNFEHLLDGALLVADMLQVASGLRVLTTSRERLNLRGETVYALQGLDFPDSQSLENIQDYAAVKLFILNAERVHPGFELQVDDLPDLLRICRQTARLPLGIELAAGWLDVLSLAQIAAEIQKGIDILETEMRDVPERHRSIRVTFERTWERLTEDEQTVFRRLSVFRGGFTVAAAEVVADAGVRNLRQLASKALVRVLPDGRHDIHELLRQFGAEKLNASGEQAVTHAKYAAFFADFMQLRRNAVFNHQQLEVLDQIGADFENIRSAWDMLVEQRAFDELPKFLAGLWFFLHVYSRNQESVELFETTVNLLQSLPASDVTALALARLWAHLAWCYHDLGLSENGIVSAEAAIRLFDQHDSPEEQLVAYQGLAVIYRYRWEPENMRQFVEKGYELALKLGNRYWEAHSLIIYSQLAGMTGDTREAILRPLRQARTIYENTQNSWGLMLSYSTEAGNAFGAGDYEQAKHWAAQCQVLAQAFGNAFFRGTSALYLGMVALRQEDYGQAWNALHQALRTFWDAGLAHFVPGPMVNLVQLLLNDDKADLAVEVIALMERYPGYHGIGALFEVGPERFEKLRQELKLRLGLEGFDAAWARGEKRELSAVVAALLSESFTK